MSTNTYDWVENNFYVVLPEFRDKCCILGDEELEQHKVIVNIRNTFAHPYSSRSQRRIGKAIHPEQNCTRSTGKGFQ